MAGFYSDVAGGGMPTTSAGIASLVTDETGTGALVLANTPTLITPVLGEATATSINDATISAADNITLSQSYGGL